ncbi:hypothetical protein [Rhodococcus aetherivorans]|uniref:hypothetical protein n=1 Tax=Rhodococcus aetherivorans TaxID=191292 RepID=UPI001E4A2AD2|nr:hypothetical protein [Rhodococcus aetherivorans]UGQ39589.1 hypothetical protein LRQ66_15440 [Rhodococcus aetherivorans]
MSVLSESVRARPRFSRSANVERDHGAHAIEGYIPTGRAIDVVSRIGRGLLDASAGRTFSITGPHGVGKSSLAVFLDGLLAPASTPEFSAAHEALRAVDEQVQRTMDDGVRGLSALEGGFVRAFGTARVEPVAATIARALHTGASRSSQAALSAVPEHFARAGEEPVSTSEILDTVRKLCAVHPVALIVDEFGKNLEAYTSSNDQGDPYLLQELAELTQGESALPLIVLTMQHLAFDDYVQETSAARRREWAKVQGRFHDIPFIETPEQSRRLIVASLERRTKRLDAPARKWVQERKQVFENLGLRGIMEESQQGIPLHPVTLAVLPDLCTRYGQNERTLFSFMAGSEPLAVPAFLDETEWQVKEQLPLLGLDRVYDYFLESATTMIGVSDTASRWLEIETRIRDTAGLSSAQLRALKSIGVLNLVSSGGKIRASRAMLHFCLLGSGDGMDSPEEVDEVLNTLEVSGLVVYRTFSDEYRVWQGSDYDLRRAIESARRQCSDLDLASLLNSATVLDPIVASRHSQRRGVLRVFQQQFTDFEQLDIEEANDTWDGFVLYATVDSPPITLEGQDGGKPVIVVTPSDLEAVREAAYEAASLQLALKAAESEKADWVAIRELVERTATAQQRLRNAVARTWTQDSTWTLVNNGVELSPSSSISALLSDVSDMMYSATPRVANEMIARRELTSQGAKARRILVEALLQSPERPQFGLEGYGPERAIYEALYRTPGVHRRLDGERWGLSVPQDPEWRYVWETIERSLRGATDRRVNLQDVCKTLAAPPIGLKAGIFPVLVVTCLIYMGDEIALYEHGSLVLHIDDAVAERLIRNPGHFTARNTGIHGENRGMVVRTLTERLRISSASGNPTLLNIATALFRELRILPPYSLKTKKGISPVAIAVREAFQTAVEPDVLLFETLPASFGLPPFLPDKDADRETIEEYANSLAEVILELRSAYNRLLDEVLQHLADATSVVGSLSEVHKRLAGHAEELDGRVLEPRLKSFVTALSRPLEDRDWLENVAMVVAGGQPPRSWTDEVALSFPLKAAEVGGTMRRTQALLYERMAAAGDADRFTSSRVTMTFPDGREHTHVVAVTDREKQTIDEYLEPLIADLEPVFGSRTAACRMLLARLVLEDEARPEPPASETKRKEAGHA